MRIDITLAGNDVVEARFAGQVVRTALDGSSPESFDLFMASLGTCTGYYVGKFCGQRGIPTDGIHIVEVVDRDPDTRLVRRIEIDVELPDRFPDKYREAVIRAAAQCSVKKVLASPPIIITRATQPEPTTR